MNKLLLIAANPKNTKPIQVSRELIEIIEVIRTARYGSHFRVIPKIGIKREELIKLLEDEKPNILHFSGHGNLASEIYLEDESGTSEPLDKETIKDILRLVKLSVRCIILNACYTEAKANFLAEEIDGAVVGTMKSIHDIEAIRFAKEFYRQLSNGSDVLRAFKAGRAQFNNSYDLLRIHSPNVCASTIRFSPKSPVRKTLGVGSIAVGSVIAFNPEGDKLPEGNKEVDDVDNTDILDSNTADDFDDDMDDLDDFDDDSTDDSDDEYDPDNDSTDDSDDEYDFDDDDFDDY